MRIEQIARVCHEANRTYCETMEMALTPSWDAAPQWMKNSAIMGVQAILDGKVAKPEDSHIAWYEHKLAEGWTYGRVKDADAKTHPCMVPYDELPEAQRAKDTLFVSIVRALMPADALRAPMKMEFKQPPALEMQRDGNGQEHPFFKSAPLNLELPLKPLDPHGLTEPLHLVTDENDQPVRIASEQETQQQEKNDGQANQADGQQVHQPAQATGDGQASEGGER